MDRFPSDNFEKALFFQQLGDTERAVKFLKEAIKSDPLNEDVLKLAQKMMNKEMLQVYESSLGILIDQGIDMSRSYFLLGKLIIEYSDDFEKGIHYLKISKNLDERYSKYSQVVEIIQWLSTGHILHSSLSEISDDPEQERLLVRGILNNKKIHSTNKVIVLEYSISKGTEFLKSIEDLIVKSSKDKDWRIRLSAIKSMAYLENADYVDLIKTLISDETERSNLPWYYWSIYKIAGDPMYFDSIENLTKDMDSTVRLNAVMVLGMCKSEKAIAPLKNILYGEDPFTGAGLWSKEQAANILIEYNTEKALKILREAELLSSNLDTKLAARKAIDQKEAQETKKRI
jgi:tetratricopeptide (TPR) repeat protein